MGPVIDAMDYVKSTLEIEMNSATDNPLIFPDERACLSGGNFHGQPISMALDMMGLGLSTSRTYRSEEYRLCSTLL